MSNVNIVQRENGVTNQSIQISTMLCLSDLEHEIFLLTVRRVQLHPESREMLKPCRHRPIDSEDGMTVLP